jgi:tetratricopeptide (TPR) repeat protein
LVGDAYLTAGQTKLGTDAFEKAIVADPDDEETWVEYGEAIWNSGNAKGAIEIAKRGAEYIDKSAVLKYRLAAYLLLSKKGREGKLFLQEAIGLDKEKIKEVLKAFPALFDNENFWEVIDLIDDETIDLRKP